MKTDSTIIPLTALLILTISAFIPVIPVTLMYWNVAFLSLFEGFRVFDQALEVNVVNLIGAMLGLLAYWFSRRISFKLLLTFAVVFFLIPFLEFERNTLGDTRPYFIIGLVEAIIVVLPLLIIGLVKEKKDLHPT